MRDHPEKEKEQTMKMTTIKTNGTTATVELAKAATLAELQAAVGGYIETVPHFETYEGEAAVAFCNEEGKVDGLPLNGVATEAWAKALGMEAGNVPWGDVLVGDVVILWGGTKKEMEAI